jgi:hypothetical protein
MIGKDETQPIELLDKRTETSKTYDNGNNTFTRAIHIEPRHYKLDYQDNKETWKDVDPTHKVETPNYIEYDQMPFILRTYKNKTGYEMISRKTGHQFTIELDELDGSKTVKKDNDGDVEFRFEILPNRVRLWKSLKTNKAPKNFKWKITEKGSGDLRFEEGTKANELSNKTVDVKVDTKKTAIDNASFYWEEKASKTGVEIDTDVSYIVGANDGEVMAYDFSAPYSWDDTHDATTGNSADNGSSGKYGVGSYVFTDGTFMIIHRVFLPFDTSGLAGNTVTAATLSFWIETGYGSGSTYTGLGLVQTSLTTSPTVDDYNDCGAVNSPTEGASQIAMTSGSFTLNATGRSWIDVDGTTCLGIRGEADIEDQGANNTGNYGDMSSSSNATEAHRPTLHITYEAGGTAANDTRQLYSKGAATSSSNRQLYSKGKLTRSDTRNLYSKGKIVSSSTRGLYSKGVATSSSNRQLYSKGSLPSSSERNLYSEGMIGSLYTRENDDTLGTDNADLSVTFTAGDYTLVATDDDDYLDLAGSNDWSTFLFKQYNSNNNNTDSIVVTWKGKTTKACTENPTILQIYNLNSAEWETLDSDSTTAENTEFTLSGTQSTDLSYYYDEDYVVSLRVCQLLSDLH